MALSGNIWRDAPLLMAALPRPARLRGTDWNALVRLVKWTVDDWAEAAIDAGWHPLEFFGCNPDPYVGRQDRDGVVITIHRMLSPIEIVSVTREFVELRARRCGSAMRYRPFGPRGQVYLWEAYAPKGGP